MGKKCFKCGDLIRLSMGQRAFTIDGHQIHHSCFKCSLCQKELPGKYFEKNGEYYDEEVIHPVTDMPGLHRISVLTGNLCRNVQSAPRISGRVNLTSRSRISSFIQNASPAFHATMKLETRDLRSRRMVLTYASSALLPRSLTLNRNELRLY